MKFLKFFLYLFKNKIILNFVIFVATKEGRTTNFFPSGHLLLLLNPGFGIRDGLKSGSGITIPDPHHWFSDWYSHVTNKSSQTGSSHTRAINRPYFPAYCIPVTGGYCQFAGSASALVSLLVLAFTVRNMIFFQWPIRRPLKNSKTFPRPLLRPRSKHTSKNKSHIHLVIQSL